jgi:alpha-N-arabinofuranosidase
MPSTECLGFRIPGGPGEVLRAAGTRGGQPGLRGPVGRARRASCPSGLAASRAPAKILGVRPPTSSAFAASALGLLLLGCVPAFAQNSVPNASFEQSEGRRPRAWRTETWAGSGSFNHANVARTGERAVELSSEQGGDLGWAATVRVEPFTRYRFSGWIKTENVKPLDGGRGALLNLHDLQGVATTAVTGTTGWTEVQTEFQTAEQSSVQVNCLLGGWGRATGKAWYDDLTLTALSQVAPPPPRLVIDAAKVGEPLSPNVYSQFIEHLGRCIYGGIWAEMLEDRKFHFPITANYNPYRSLRDTPYPVVGASPWKVMGDAGGVTMSTNRPFVGRHSPRLQRRQRHPPARSGRHRRQVLLRLRLAPVRPAAAPTATVTLAWGIGDGPGELQTVGDIAGEFRRYPFQFTPGETSDKAWVELRVDAGAVLVGTASLMPDDNVEGMRADTLALLKELRAPIFRWPGGNFVSGYDWRDGIGDRDRRPPRTNPAWTGVEHNDFGMHEFIRFCRSWTPSPGSR